MRKDGLEDIYKDRFDNHSESIDADDMIARLGLDQKEEKNRPFILWMFGVVIGLLLIAVVVYAFSDSDNGLKSAIAHEQEVLSGKKNGVENNDVNREEKDIIEFIDETSSRNIGGEKLVNNTTNQNIIKDENQFSDSQANVGKISEERNGLVGKKYKEYVSNDQPIVQTKRNFVSNEKIIVLENSTPNSDVYSNENALVESIKFESSIDLETKTSVVLSFPTIKTIGMRIYNDSELEGKFDPIIVSSSNIIGKSRIDALPFFIEAYAAVYLTNRELVASSSIYDAHVDMRNKTENQLETIQCGLAISKSLSKRFYVSSGIEYTHINEEATISYMNDTILIDDNFPVLLQFRANGDTITSFGAVNIDSEIKHTLIEYNHHKLFSIPVNFGVQASVGKFSLFAEAGISLNLYQGFYGKVVDIDQYIMTSPIYFKSKLGLGFRSRMGLVYPVSQNLGISVSANLQKTHSVSDVEFVSQKYGLRGLSLGVKYQL